jgi:leucyl aminopeptidase
MATLTLTTTIPKSATAIDVPVASDRIDALGEDLARTCELQGFKGDVGQTLVIAGPAGEPMQVLVGIGAIADLDVHALRSASASFVRAVENHKAVATTLVDAAPDIDSAAALRAVVEGASLASYRYTALKSDPDVTLRKVSVVARFKGAKAAFTATSALVDAAALARDLGNEPGGSLVPSRFVERAREVAKASGLKVTVWDEKRIARERLGGIEFVNKGSTHPARLLMISYRPSGTPTANLALVGKGITFDSGGLSIKTGTGMMTMKIDMAGGAAVLGAMSALGALGTKAAVTAYIPLTDNMINGDASRPGDVFTARNGKTVEVLNTDAEGRLVLADALSLAAEKAPDAIIDIATLTGSVTAALGTGYAGVMGNNEHVVSQLATASTRTGEKIWELPLPEEYRTTLDSVVADLKNIGSTPYGGALTAGLFLKEFVGDVPWAHLDLGMSAMSEQENGIVTKGATGFGVRLLADACANWSQPTG